MQLFEQLINGLQLGSIYALIAIGYTMVYGIAKLINFVHGDFIMFGGYLTFWLLPVFIRFNIPVVLIFIPVILGCALLGFIVEKVAYKPLRESSRITLLITAIALSLFIENVFMVIFEGRSSTVQPIFNLKPVAIGSIMVSMNSIITIAISLLSMLILHLVVNKTRVGKAMRAVSQNKDAAKLMGININKIISITFIIGGALAGIASVMYVNTYQFVKFDMGSMLGLKAFVAAVLGGIGSIPGAMLGGFLIGLVEVLSVSYISSQLANAIVFTILIIILIFKPNGILGKRQNIKV
ncbi:MAG: branched-chain amino acid ABC transporter permease [Bacilli bacterium]|nr:branched-chain amino acid ABC transporter permease [Bacilli bacterium]